MNDKNIMDFAAVINELIIYFEDYNSWQITKLISHPDLKAYEKRNTKMTLFPVIFVKEFANQIEGFWGDAYLPTTYSNGDGGTLYLHISYD